MCHLAFIQKSLKYCTMGSLVDICSLGHEYVSLNVIHLWIGCLVNGQISLGLRLEDMPQRNKLGPFELKFDEQVLLEVAHSMFHVCKLRAPPLLLKFLLMTNVFLLSGTSSPN